MALLVVSNSIQSIGLPLPLKIKINYTFWAVIYKWKYKEWLTIRFQSTIYFICFTFSEIDMFVFK